MSTYLNQKKRTGSEKLLKKTQKAYQKPQDKTGRTTNDDRQPLKQGITQSNKPERTTHNTQNIPGNPGTLKNNTNITPTNNTERNKTHTDKKTGHSPGQQITTGRQNTDKIINTTHMAGPHATIAEMGELGSPAHTTQT